MRSPIYVIEIVRSNPADHDISRKKKKREKIAQVSNYCRIAKIVGDLELIFLGKKWTWRTQMIPKRRGYTLPRAGRVPVTPSSPLVSNQETHKEGGDTGTTYRNGESPRKFVEDQALFSHVQM